MLDKIKLALRIKHAVLDEDVQSDIDACLADLRTHGVTYAPDDDPLIFNAVKLFCRSIYTDDPAKGAEYLARYERLRDCLKVAEGYGWEAGADE